MSRSNVYRFFLLSCLAILAQPGCVKRLYDAPGLPPGSAMAVGSEMRVETFEVDQWEVRAYRIPPTEGNKRLYQFLVLKDGVYDHDYSLDQLEDGTWALIEKRSDGISITRKTFPVEPDYSAVKAEVAGLLQPPGFGGRPCVSA